MDEEEDKKPKQFGDLMSVEAPSMIPSHEERGGYSPSYHGDDRKLYRNPTLDERLILYPGQALESIKDVITRPSSSPNQISSTSSWVTEALGKIPEAAWSVLDPLIEQTGKDVTQAYSKISGEDQGKKLATVTALTSMMMGMVKPPKGAGGGRRTKITNQEMLDYIAGKGKNPASAVGINDDAFEPFNTGIQDLMDVLDPDNLPKARYSRNPQIDEDANNVLSKWRNMLEDWYSWSIQDSEQVTAGINPKSRFFTVPNGFDAEGKSLFKAVDTQEAVEEALAKARFDMRKELFRYFDFDEYTGKTTRGALPPSEMTQEQREYQKFELAQIGSDKDLKRGIRMSHDGRTDHPVLGRKVFSIEDDSQNPKLIQSTDVMRLKGPHAGGFLDATEEVEIPESMLMTENAWGRFNDWYLKTYDRPFVRPAVSDKGVLFRISSPEDVKDFSLAAGQWVKPYLLDIGLADTDFKIKDEEMLAALTKVEGDLYKKVDLQRRIDINTPEEWAREAGQEIGEAIPVLKKFPLIAGHLEGVSGKYPWKVGRMLVNELIPEEGIFDMFNEIEQLYGALGKDTTKEYTTVMQKILEEEVTKRMNAWWDERLNLSLGHGGSLFGDKPESTSAYPDYRWRNR